MTRKPFKLQPQRCPHLPPPCLPSVSPLQPPCSCSSPNKPTACCPWAFAHPLRRPRLLTSGNHMILPYFFSNPPPREACLNHPRDETPPHPPPRAVSPADGRCLLSCCPSSSPAETSQMLSLLTILLSAQYLTQRRCLISTGALTATRAD